MTSRVLVLVPIALGLLAGCVQATPDLVLRDETAPPMGVGLCQRMKDDFDMVLAGGSPLRGQLYRVSHADRLISAHGVSWGFRLEDDNPEETCVSTADGVTCTIEGPAEFRIQSNAGRAVYQVAAGDRAVVTSEGAIMTCQEVR